MLNSFYLPKHTTQLPTQICPTKATYSAKRLVLIPELLKDKRTAQYAKITHSAQGHVYYNTKRLALRVLKLGT